MRRAGVLAIAASLALTPAALAMEEAVPPVGTEHEMSLAELRYCYFQEVRLKSANDALNASSQFEIDRFNELVDDWNARCSSYRYLPDDLDAVETSTALKRVELEMAGKALVVGWRSARAASLFHVTASALNLRAAPSADAQVIGKLKRFKDLRATGPEVDGWLPVEAGGKKGFVARAYVAQGSGKEPRRAYCSSVAGLAPYNGEVLVGEGDGPHVVRIDNGLSKDALVKLKDRGGTTRLAFYVVAGQTAEIGDVPDGNYRLLFATGDGFSRGCNRFIDNMRAQAFANREVFEATVEGDTQYYSTLSITLHPVEGGTASTSEVDLDEFED